MHPREHGKGQAAIEYLMNYAWAIALIIIGITAIFSLDIGGLKTAVSSSGAGGSSNLAAQFEHVAISGHRLHGCNTNRNCTLDLAFKNNGDQRINITNITIQELDGGSINEMVNRSGSCSFGIDLFPGDTETCTGIVFDASNRGNLNPGNPYSFRIQLTYSVLDFNANTLFTQSPERVLHGELETS